MARKAKPIQVDAATRIALYRGRDRYSDPKRQRHWQALCLLLEQPQEEYSISSVARQLKLSESRIRQIVTQFEKEGLSFLERKYRRQDPIRKGRGRRPKLSKEEMQLLNDNVLAGSLEDIKAWVLAWTGKTISLSTASRLRSKAKEARHQIQKKRSKKRAVKKAPKQDSQVIQPSLFSEENSS